MTTEVEQPAPDQFDEPQARPITVEELKPFFASMPSDVGGLVYELALARYRWAEASGEVNALRQQLG